MLVDDTKKQNILIVHNYYQIPGGEDTVVANEKKLLEDHGHAVLLYCRNNSELKGFSKLQKLMLPITTVFNPKTYREVKRVIRENNVDIVHVHNTLNLISPSVYYAARAMKVPVVQTVHNFRLLCPGATFYRNGHICEDCVSKGLMCAVKHSCYRDSKLQTLACVISTKIHRMTGIYRKLNYICLTEFNREKLLQFKQIKPSQVFVKPNFVDSKDMIVVPFEQRENRFIFVGRLDKLKGIDLLLESWNQMGSKAPRLLICGTGPMEDWCRKYIEKNHLREVEIMGFLPNNEVRQLIANSKALILPTQWYEGFPMTIVEAYSVGTPVIGPDMGNVGDLVVNNETGLKFRYDSTKELINAVDIFEKMDRKWQDNCKYIFEKRYSPEHNIIILNDVYEEIEKMNVEKMLKIGGGVILLKDYAFNRIEIEVAA